METNKGRDQTQSPDPLAEALRQMISSLLDEKLQPINVELANLSAQLFRMEEASKARYGDLRTRRARMQDSLDVLNEKFDAQSNEVKFLRKSVRLLEDKVDPVTA